MLTSSVPARTPIPSAQEDTQLKKLLKDASKLGREHVQGLMQQVMKDAEEKTH